MKKVWEFNFSTIYEEKIFEKVREMV